MFLLDLQFSSSGSSRAVPRERACALRATSILPATSCSTVEEFIAAVQAEERRFDHARASHGVEWDPKLSLSLLLSAAGVCATLLIRDAFSRRKSTAQCKALIRACCDFFFFLRRQRPHGVRTPTARRRGGKTEKWTLIGHHSSTTWEAALSPDDCKHYFGTSKTAGGRTIMVWNKWGFEDTRIRLNASPRSPTARESHREAGARIWW